MAKNTKVNFSDWLIPGAWADLYVSLNQAKVVYNQDEKRYEYHVPEETIVQLLLKCGAIPPIKNEFIPENSAINEGTLQESKKASDNQMDYDRLPKALLEIWKAGQTNFLKALMEYQGIELKTLAARYGGSSASANLANFLAKSDQELSSMRPSTLQKLAQAFQVPIEWLTAGLGIHQD